MGEQSTLPLKVLVPDKTPRKRSLESTSDDSNTFKDNNKENNSFNTLPSTKEYILEEPDQKKTKLATPPDDSNLETLAVDSGTSDQADTSQANIITESTTSTTRGPSHHKMISEGVKKLKKEKEEAEKKAKKQQLESERQERQTKKEQEELEKRLKKEKIEAERQAKKRQEELEKIAKREKLEAERQAKKEQKEKEKLEKQLKREEEAKIRELKKQEEEEERERKRLDIEQKRRLKEEERLRQAQEKERLKEQEKEKLKKQSIMNFFKSKTPIRNSTLPTTLRTDDNSPSPSKSHVSDYESYFLPFYLKANTRIVNNSSSLDNGRDLDLFLKGEKNVSTPDFGTFLQTLSTSSQNSKFPTATDVVQLMNMDMTKEAENMLKTIPTKYLQFYENSKPPYLGTYSYTINDCEEKIATNPFLHVTSEKLQFNYDYDSDLEEDEDDEEGEDIDKEDEDEDDESDTAMDDQSDIDEFVDSDDANNTATKKKIMGPLIPVTSWIGKTVLDENDEFGNYFNGLQYERLRHNIIFPIDPFYNYWDESPEEESKESKSDLATSVSATVVSKSESLLTENSILTPTKVSTKIITSNMTPSPANSTSGTAAKNTTITEQCDLLKLKEFIMENKEFTINTLTEVFQKQILSKYSKAVVKNSIKLLASFDKKKNRWEINEF